MAAIRVVLASIRFSAILYGVTVLPTQEWDKLIRSGRGDQVREILNKLPRDFPREQLAKVARLARRVNLHQLSLEYLNPIVRGNRRTLLKEATDMEKAEYAATLSFVGAQEEAKALLAGINTEKYPMALLYLSYVLFSEWDYESAIPVLKKFIENEEGDYERLIGKTNLAAAYVYERKWTEARSLIQVVAEQATRDRSMLLLANSLELQAQCMIGQGELTGVDSYLDEAERTLVGSQGLDKFFIQKWKAIAKFLMDPSRKGELLAAKSSALELRHYESVRDCDRYLAIGSQDENSLWHVYFGTPFEKFRERLLKDFPESIEVPAYYDWNLSESSPRRKAILKMEVLEKQKGLRPGLLLHRLFICFTRDFYRPSRPALVHHMVFPNEYFNPDTSPGKVHEAVRRFREWLTKSKLEISLDLNDDGYFLTATGVAIRVEAEKSNPGHLREVALTERVHAKWGFEAFTSQDAATLLEMSERNATRFLKNAVEQGEIIRERAGRKILYRVSSSKTKL